MTTVFDVIIQALRNLEATWEGEVDSGSTTTVVDTEIGSAVEGGFITDDEFNGGTLLMPYTTDALAPAKEIRRVSDYVYSTGTLTAAPAFTVAPGAGDRYALVGRRYPLMQMYAKLNEVLAEVGEIPTEYTDAAFVTAAATREYALPTAAKRDPRQLFIGLSDTQPYDWQPVTQWDVRWAGPNTATYIIFPYQPLTGLPLKLVYLAPHPAVALAADYVSDYLPVDFLATELALRLARWRLHQPGADAETQVSLINDLMNRRQKRPQFDLPALNLYPYRPD